MHNALAGDVPPQPPEIGDEETRSLQIESNVWDIALVVGTSTSKGPLMTWFRVAETFLLMIANLIIQLTFSLWAGGFIGADVFSEEALSGMLHWRLVTGQSYAEVDLAHMKTLTYRLCEGGVTSHLAGIVGDLDEFVQKFSLADRTVPGNVLMIISIGIWVLLIVTELRLCFTRWSAILSAPAHPENLPGFAEEDEEGNLRITHCRTDRKIVLSIFVLFPRFGISIILLIAGIFFLGETYSIEDVILNACALEIVKCVDELLFEALTSKPMQKIAERSSLVYRVKQGAARVWLPWLARMVLVIALMVFGVKLANDMTATLDFVAERVCGHQTQFVHSAHPISGLPTFSSFSEDDVKAERLDELKCYYRAEYHMLEVRAGFDASDENLTNLVSGTSDLCNDSTVQCPEYSITEFRILESTVRGQALQSSKWCKDQEVAFKFIARNCSDNDAEVSDVVRRFFSRRSRCSQTASIFAQGGDCHSSTITGPTTLSPDWCHIIKNVCPLTANICNLNTASGAPTSRRLSGMTPKPMRAPMPGVPHPGSGRASGLGRSRRLSEDATRAPAALGRGGSESARSGLSSGLRQESAALAQRVWELENMGMQRRMASLGAQSQELSREVEELKRLVSALAPPGLAPRAGGGEAPCAGAETGKNMTHPA